MNDIKNAILTNTSLNLDFIYGRIENNTLIPIDGQQRLTTLFLLHWYFAVKENKLGNENNKEILKKFTYETRLSSIDFCNNLLEYGEAYDELINNKETEEKVSDLIKDSSWYFLSWKYDSTIFSMLNMLDKIQDIFKDVKNAVFEKLQGKSSPITFYFLDLKKFKLTDELYIKMNARGKQLTEFENFKTLFSAYLDSDNKANLDNKWLDIFWNIEKANSKKEMDANKVDGYYYNFFQNITSLFYAESHNIEEIENYSLFKDYEAVYGNAEGTEKYEQKVVYILDALSLYDDSEKLFKNFLLSPQPKHRIKFYALSFYFIWQANNKGGEAYKEEVYHNWMRLTKNLINNRTIASTEAYKKGVLALKDLSQYIENILEYVSEFGEKISFFSMRQKKEEKLKAQLILKDKEWQVLLEKAENHSYFIGQVGFILEYAKKDNGYSKEDFQNYSDKLMKLFGDEFKESHNFLFQRALLSKENYLIKSKLDRCSSNHSFCSFKGNKEHNWRGVFNDSERAFVLKELLDDIKGDNILAELNRIVNDSNIGDWRDIIIKNPECISYCEKRQIRFEDDGKIYLISKAKMSSKHRELFSYNLFLKTFNGNEYKPFSSVYYYTPTNSYEEPCIVLDSFMYKEHEFYMDIQHAGERIYNFIFSYRGERKPKAFSDISNILQKIGFKKEEACLKMDGIREAKVEKKVEEICKEVISQLNL